MKRCLTLFAMLMSAGVSLWALGYKEGNSFCALSCGWLGSVKLNNLTDSSEVIRLGVNSGNEENLLSSDTFSDERFKMMVAEEVSSVDVGVEGRAILSEKWGIGCRIDFFFPQSVSYQFELTEGNRDDIKRFSRDRGDFTFLQGLDLFSGVVFMPIRTSRWGLVLMYGPHMGVLMTDTKSMASTQVVVGLGAEISADVYFGNHFYLNGGIVLVYDFLSATSFKYTDSERIIRDSSGGPTAYISIQPKIAAGFRI